MRKIIILSLLICCSYSTIAQRRSADLIVSPRIEKIINSDWTFNYFPSENAGEGYEEATYNDLNWPIVSIPHTWSTYETTGDIHPFIKDTSENDNPYWWRGWGWYRKHFIVNERYAGQKIFVEFEGIQKYCKVWLNGKYLGDHKGGYGSFDFDITSHVVPGKDNVLAIAVNNRKNDEYNIPPMNPDSFYVYGGINRDVKLTIKDRLYIPMQGSATHEGGTFVTTPSVSSKKAIVRVRTWVKNDYDQPISCVLNTYITDASGKIIKTITSRQTINPGQLYMFDQVSKKIKKPRLWSPEDPYLYTVYSEVTDGARVTDSYTSPLGFRWFRWDYNENALYLNGEKLVPDGGKYRQEYPWLGEAVPAWITENNVKNIRESGQCNLLLAYGHPGDRYLYELTDKQGFITIEESASTGNQPFSEAVQEQQMKEMIRRDRNHPSILFWSMGRMTDNAVDSRYAHNEDTTRILTACRVTGGSAGSYTRHRLDNMVFKELEQYPSHGGYVAGQDIVTGEPAKIVITGSHKSIKADRGSIVILTADIVDSQGNSIRDATNTIKWSVTGPARLTGPSVFESERGKYSSDESALYKKIPVFNIIRSTGKQGKIMITASASGLASGSFEVDAGEVKSDDYAITEPVLIDEGRRPVPKAVLVVERLEEIPAEIEAITADFNAGSSDKKGYINAVREFIKRNNPQVDTTTVEFRSLVELFASYLVNNNGRLAAEDYNFSVNHYNNCRLVSGYIDATKLPQLFKDGLKRYYSEAIIKYGSERNAGDEMNWMNWIPSGGIVIVSQEDGSREWPAGTMITGKDRLDDLIAEVHPVFVKYGDFARERALTFVSKMNPYIHQVKEGNSIIYRAEKDKPILIPLIKFIAQ
jgi:hypothetical protein